MESADPLGDRGDRSTEGRGRWGHPTEDPSAPPEHLQWSLCATRPWRTRHLLSRVIALGVEIKSSA
eukprot:3227100-Alexandrium_andersonii.AAC.1